MKSLWILILISIVTNIIGSIGKANQKKKPITSSAKKVNQTDYNYKNWNTKPKKSKNYIDSLEYESASIKQSVDCNQKNSVPSFIAEEAAPIQKESVKSEQDECISEEEDFFDIGLSELQNAIVMTEILNKPLALRK